MTFHTNSLPQVVATFTRDGRTRTKYRIVVVSKRGMHAENLCLEYQGAADSMGVCAWHRSGEPEVWEDAARELIRMLPNPPPEVDNASA